MANHRKDLFKTFSQGLSNPTADPVTGFRRPRLATKVLSPPPRSHERGPWLITMKTLHDWIFKGCWYVVRCYDVVLYAFWYPCYTAFKKIIQYIGIYIYIYVTKIYKHSPTNYIIIIINLCMAYGLLQPWFQPPSSTCPKRLWVKTLASWQKKWT